VKYLLDTNTLIYFFKGKGRVAEHLFSVPPSSLLLSSVVLYELETGIAKSSDAAKRRRQLDVFAAAVTIAPFGSEEAKLAAMIRARLETAGTPIGLEDTLIAATALAHKAILVTHNIREFSRIPELQIEDWF
jgi:tRNA(fMet)-specific endonuclease VapC